MEEQNNEFEQEKIRVNNATSKDGSNLGIWSLVSGILSFFVPFVGLVLAIVAIVLGQMALKAFDRDGVVEGRGLAKAGRIIGIISLALMVVGFIIMFMMVGSGFWLYF